MTHKKKTTKNRITKTRAKRHSQKTQEKRGVSKKGGFLGFFRKNPKVTHLGQEEENEDTFQGENPLITDLIKSDGRYIGNINNNGKRHGKGKLIGPTFTIIDANHKTRYFFEEYVGGWVNGKKEGLCVETLYETAEFYDLNNLAKRKIKTSVIFTGYYYPHNFGGKDEDFGKIGILSFQTGYCAKLIDRYFKDVLVLDDQTNDEATEVQRLFYGHIAGIDPELMLKDELEKHNNQLTWDLIPSDIKFLYNKMMNLRKNFDHTYQKFQEFFYGEMMNIAEKENMANVNKKKMASERPPFQFIGRFNKNGTKQTGFLEFGKHAFYLEFLAGLNPDIKYENLISNRYGQTETQNRLVNAYNKTRQPKIYGEMFRNFVDEFKNYYSPDKNNNNIEQNENIQLGNKYEQRLLHPENTSWLDEKDEL